MHKRDAQQPGRTEWRRYLRFWGRDIQRDIDDELRFHIEMRERDFLASGLAAHEAHAAAIERFGNVNVVSQQLRAHDVNKQRRENRVEIMENLAQDLRYGVRKLLQAPGFTLAIVLVLALGIGVNSAIFSAVDAAILRPLPFRDAERLVILDDHVRLPPTMRIDGAPPVKRGPDINDVAAMKDVVEGIGGYAPGSLNLTGSGSPLRVKVALATPSLLTVLGVVPAAGRNFVEAEGKSATSDVAMISYGLWKRQFGSDSGIVGRSISLNGVAHTVVGVMPDKFVFPSGTEVWIPLTVPFSWAGARREAIGMYLPLTLIAKLAPGVSALTAGKRIRAQFEPFATAKKPITFTAQDLVKPLQQTMVKDRRTALLVLMGGALLVLLTACANVTNLLLSRAAARRREIGIRAALGASRTRILQQLITESLLLAFAGGILGIFLAYAGLGVLTTLLPAELVDIIPPRIDARVLAFSLLLATATGLVFGLWPAFGLTRKSSNAAGRGSSYGATAGDNKAIRRVFVVSEMAFALMLLIGAGLMLRSFRELVSTDTGVQVDRVASVELTLPKARYANDTLVMVFHDALLDRLRRTPGVEAVASINEIPLRGAQAMGISAAAEGKPRKSDEDAVYPTYLRVTPDYFRTMGIRIISGRTLGAAEDLPHQAAVINKAMADKLWPGEDAVGKRFEFGTMPGEAPNYVKVVGVIANVRAQSIENKPMPQMYFQFRESPSQIAGVVVRGTGNPGALLGILRTAVKAIDADQPLFNLQVLSETVSRNIAPRRTNTLLFSAFGLLAVILSAFGVYAVIAYGVAQRTREIGIRIALGADLGGVMRMVMSEGLMLGVVGIAVGLGGAWALTRIMKSLLFGVTVHDPLTFVAAPALLLVIACLATLLPARAAARVDPLKAIRAE